MARKPKGWTDNPLGEIQKLYNAWQPNYTDPQSLAQFKETSKQVGSMGLQAADMYATGGLGLSFAQNVIQPAALIASAETRTAAASKGMTQFAKDAAITAAAAGAGYVVGKAVQAGAAKVVESGIPARVVNKMKNETVLVHGSPKSGLTEIKPTASSNLISNENPGYAVAYGWKPEEVVSRTQLVKNVEFYAQGQKNYRVNPLGEKIVPEPTGYVTKVNINATAPTQKFLKEPGIIAKGNWASVKPLKIVDEIPMSGKTIAQLEQEFSKKIKRAGGKLPAKPKPVKTVSTVPPPRT